MPEVRELQGADWSGRFVHVMNAEKFIAPYIGFVHAHFDPRDHLFLVRHSATYSPSLPRHPNVVTYDAEPGGRWRKLALFRHALGRAERIFLHSLFYDDVMVMLLAQPTVLARCYWLIWGADLYTATRGQRSMRARASEWLRRQVVRRIGHLVTYIPGDAALARQWYGARGTYEECLLYTSNVLPEAAEERAPSTADGRVHVLVGNSADRTNEHEDAFERLRAWAGDDVVVHCPLSYGDAIHAREVEALGRRLFGERFSPLTKMMPAVEYRRFLCGMDIAVFAHRRQQAMGNTIQLLGAGRRVYMRRDVTQFSMLRQLGIAVQDLDDLRIPPSPDPDLAAAPRRVADYFNPRTLEGQYRHLFA